MNQLHLTEHGSARWLEKNEAIKAGLIDKDGITLGHAFGKRWGAEPPAVDPVTYTGEAHMVTIAKNRSGKGTSAIVPALLSYEGGILCIDPKGENAIITAHQRRRMGQDVQILDPWKIALKRLEGECGFDGSDDEKPPFQAASFNPLDMIAPDSMDLTDDTMTVAEALITESGNDPHWSQEGKAAMAGLIMHVITSPKEEGQRHLPRVRDIISMPPKEFGELVLDMAQSHVPAVRNAANRLRSKTEKELASVMSTAASNTHFLDSPAIRSTLESSSFDFGGLKDNDRPLTVFLVLPAERLKTHGRWLRLLVSMGLTAITRKVGKPKKSALFILDEFAALDRLQMVEEAFGLMAGFGMRIWIILQDLSQVQDLYKTRWQTFLANAGVIQIFGINEPLTAEYFSRYMGQQTVEQISKTTAEIRQGGFLLSAADPHYRSMKDRSFGRSLMTADELMKMPNDKAILMISPHDPMIVDKVVYYQDARFIEPETSKRMYVQHPDYKADPTLPIYATGRIGRAVVRHLNGDGKPEKTRFKWTWTPLKYALGTFLLAVALWQWDQCGWDNTPPNEAQCFYKWGAEAPPIWEAIQPFTG
ncbi:type IV secretory system conjugative DNA transfer family protein [uncultured Roseobacter sp.]|uniref:type IV secretory system conjugative DNA transfer family protein n=1 Tax=uncultured Roseobacter sp. TaxID=114847 RepID=UPI0026033362|nr:type IV secretory system conjugative DNA transfer family protein [uncultured Roseobacter sp.]